VAGASFPERYLPRSESSDEEISIVVWPESLKLPVPYFTDTGSGMIDIFLLCAIE
jgi:hypothetical protein